MFIYLLWLVLVMVPIAFGVYLAIYILKHHKTNQSIDAHLNAKKGLGAGSH